MTQLPKGLKYLYVSWMLEAEVFNGGFNQYFYNTSGVFIDEAINAYNYFELYDISSIIEEAARIAVQEIDMYIKTKKQGTLEAFSNSYNLTNLGEVDDKFYENGTCISETRINFIRNNICDFICT